MNRLMEENEKLRGLLRESRKSVHYQMEMQNLNHEAGRRHYGEFNARILRIDAALLSQMGDTEESDTVQDEREAVQTIGYAWINRYNDGVDHVAPFPPTDGGVSFGEPLMAVEQHSRIVAALTRPAQTAPQPTAEYPHDVMDALALSRYRVGHSASGIGHRYAVRAGDGEQELYRGSKSDCEYVARKLTGAFLDGGLALYGSLSAPQPEQSVLAEALEQYANDSNWCYDTCNISRDVAKRALAAYRAAKGDSHEQGIG